MRPATGLSISGAASGQPRDQPGVVVPLRVGPVGSLHEPHPRLGEPPGEQAAQAEVARHRVVQAVQPPGGLGLALDAHQLGRLGLHAERELVRLDAALEGEVGPGRLELAALPALQQVDLGPLHGGADRVVLEEVDGRVGGAHPRVADGGAVVGGREERGRVVSARRRADTTGRW